MEKMSGSTPFD